MRATDVCNDSDLRLQQVSKRSDLARMIHSDFEYAVACLLRHPHHGEWKADMIVVISSSTMRFTFHGQYVGTHFFDGGLANTSGAIKKYPQAISAFKKTIELKPEEGLGKVGLAFAYFGDEKPGLAIEELKDAMTNFKANKNISWYRDCRLAIRQIKDFARFPPKFAELWLKNNLKRVQDTFEKSVLDFANILKSD